MPRRKKVDYPGARVHIYNRAANGQVLFPTRATRRRFLDRLQEGAERHGVLIHAYALPTNHYHLALTSLRGELPAFMRFVMGPTSRRINQQLAREAQLCRAPYFSKHVDSDAYWRHLAAYIHQNTARIDDELVSSHGQYLRTTPGLADPTEHLELFGGPGPYLDYLAALDPRPRHGDSAHDFAVQALPIARLAATRLAGEARSSALIARWLHERGLPTTAIASLLGCSLRSARRLLALARGLDGEAALLARRMDRAQPLRTAA